MSRKDQNPTAEKFGALARSSGEFLSLSDEGLLTGGIQVGQKGTAVR